MILNVKKRIVILVVALTAFSHSASAQSLSGWPLTLQECSECHLAYQPKYLPMRSWRKILRNLDNHFGEDASLDNATARAIEKYLVKYAGDSPQQIALHGGMSSYMASIRPGTTPMKITNSPWFTWEHGPIGSRTRQYAESRPNIGTISNCTGCHR